MLQAFLQQLVPALEESIKLAVPLGILLAIILPLPNQSIRHTFVRVLKWGFFLSLFMTAVRVGTKSAVNREIFESMAIGVDLVGALVLCTILLRSLHREWTSKEERPRPTGRQAAEAALRERALRAPGPRVVAADDDSASIDDEDISDSSVVGLAAVLEVLGGRVIEEKTTEGTY